MTATEIQRKAEIQGVTKRRNTMIKQVQRAMDIVPTPQKIEDITLTDEEKKYLIHMDERMMVFGDSRLYEIFKASKQLFLYGTFNSVLRKLYYQLYTVHCESNGSVFPVFYALLINKNNDTYKHLIEVIESSLGQNIFHEKRIVLGDFEIVHLAGLGNEIQK